jgi:hypothetical protein
MLDPQVWMIDMEVLRKEVRISVFTPGFLLMESIQSREIHFYLFRNMVPHVLEEKHDYPADKKKSSQT